MLGPYAEDWITIKRSMVGGKTRGTERGVRTCGALTSRPASWLGRPRTSRTRATRELTTSFRSVRSQGAGIPLLSR